MSATLDLRPILVALVPEVLLSPVIEVVVPGSDGQAIPLLVTEAVVRQVGHLGGLTAPVRCAGTQLQLVGLSHYLPPASRRQAPRQARCSRRCPQPCLYVLVSSSSSTHLKHAHSSDSSSKYRSSSCLSHAFEYFSSAYLSFQYSSSSRLPITTPSLGTVRPRSSCSRPADADGSR